MVEDANGEIEPNPKLLHTTLKSPPFSPHDRASMATPPLPSIGHAHQLLAPEIPPAMVLSPQDQSPKILGTEIKIL